MKEFFEFTQASTGNTHVTRVMQFNEDDPDDTHKRAYGCLYHTSQGLFFETPAGDRYSAQQLTKVIEDAIAFNIEHRDPSKI